MNTPIDPTLPSDLAALTPTEQQSVADFVRSLRNGTRAATSRPPGTPAEKLLTFHGVLPDEDAEEIMRAIEEGCGQVESADSVDARTTRAERLRRLAGRMSDSEAAKMLADIEEGCGQVNHAAW
ncbi:MAG: hypothetical protein ACRCT8_00325 [Lacipirellulaceae bacterium]